MFALPRLVLLGLLMITHREWMVGSGWRFGGACQWPADSDQRLGFAGTAAQELSYVSTHCSADVMTQRYDSVLRSLIGSIGIVAK